MKKLFVLLMSLTMALVLAACSSNEEADKAEKATNKADEAETNKAETKKALVKLYAELGNVVNEKDVDLNVYVEKATKEEPKPEDLPTAEDRAKASASAAAVATELKNMTIPEGLTDQKADLELAISDYVKAYEEKAEELKKESPSLEAGEEAFASGEQKLGEVFENADLYPPSLGPQVN